MDILPISPQHRMDDDRRQEPERAEPDRRQQGQRTDDADLGELVGREREQVPDESEDPGGEQQWIDPRPNGRSSAGANDHRQQHGVERDARAETDQIEQLTHRFLRQ